MSTFAADGMAFSRVERNHIDPLIQVITLSTDWTDTPALRKKALEYLNRGVVLIATNHDRAIGCIFADVGHVVVLHSVCVIPAERKRGRAHTLIAAALEHADISERARWYCAAIDPDRLNAEKGFFANGFAYYDDETVQGLRVMHKEGSRTAPNSGIQ